MTSITKAFFVIDLVFYCQRFSFLKLMQKCRSISCKEYRFWSLGPLPTGSMIASPSFSIQILKFSLHCQELTKSILSFIQFSVYPNNSLSVWYVQIPEFGVRNSAEIRQTRKYCGDFKIRGFNEDWCETNQRGYKETRKRHLLRTWVGVTVARSRVVAVG